MHFYGYDWVGSVGEGLEWREVARLIEREQVTVVRDQPEEPWFTYDGGRRTVYFTDAAAVGARVAAIRARHPNLAGIAIWRLGGEDPGNWPALRHALRD
jgi:spore germination protein YaaH